MEQSFSSNAVVVMVGESTGFCCWRGPTERRESFEYLYLILQFQRWREQGRNIVCISESEGGRGFSLVSKRAPLFLLCTQRICSGVLSESYLLCNTHIVGMVFPSF